MNVSQKCTLPHRSLIIRPNILGHQHGIAANYPDSPPITNIATNATALSIGMVNLMLPRHIVPIQLNVFTAEGTAITSVETMNDDPSVGFMPLTNMWWPHTIQPRNAIATIANTI